LPAAKRDVANIIHYISDTLDAPRTALNFLEAVENAENEIKNNPYAFHRYQGTGKLKNEYRVKHVKNYSVFYTISGRLVTIRRVLYSKMNIAAILR
jgi:plasmid stabilization system protein ParE